MDDPAPLLARFGDFQIDEGNARLSRDGRPLELQPKAFGVLCTLLRRPGQLVAKDTLLDAVWGHRHISESVLKTVVSHLRQVLADDARAPRYIETAARRGYRFIGTLDVPPVALPAAHARLAAAPPAAGAALVGRAAALAALHEALAAAARGQRQLLLVAGEAGIGKSTLIERFVAAPLAGRPAVAFGQCVEHYGAGEPYMPVLEALNLLCRGADGDALLALMRRVAPTWLAQLPWFLAEADREPLQREVAGASPERMLRELGELLDRCTAERPLLLVLEDLHWSDHATIQLLGYLARRRGPAALLLVGSFRPTEVIVAEHPLAGLRQELRLHRLCREIDLETLSEVEVAELVAARLDGAAAPEPFVRALHAHTEGLPLFVVNVLDELFAEGLLRRAGAGWAFPPEQRFPVPHGIVGVVEKQVARLPPATQRLLEAASIAGDDFHAAALAALLPQPEAELDASLDALIARRQWLGEAGVATLGDGRLAARYRFRHALYRHVFYARLGPAQRMQGHRRFAAALLDTQGDAAPELAAELAMHFERGGEPLAAAAQLARVGHRALARSAAREALGAARHGRQLLEPLHDHPGRDDVELELCVIEGVALSRLHVISEPEVAAAFERTRALCERAVDGAARARALHGLWWVSFARGELAQALALAQRMLARPGAEPALQLAGCSALGITLAMRGELREAAARLAEALAIYAAAGERLPPGIFVQDPGVEARGYLALLEWWRGEPAAARRLAGEAVALADALRHPISQLIALHLAAVLHYFAGEHREAMALTRRLFEVVQRHELPRDPGSFTWLHGHLVADEGRVDEGLALMHEAERSCRRLGMHIGLTGYQLHLAQACRTAGRRAEAHAAADQGLALAAQREERFLLAALHGVKAELQLDDGDAAGAAASLGAALDAARAQGAAFHELAALVAAGRLPQGVPAPERARLRELLDIYGDEDIALVRQGQALLAA